MAKKTKRSLVALLALLMCMSMTAMAAPQTLEGGYIWHGNDMSRVVTAGENEYTFMAIYQPPYANYETSNHILQKAGAVSLLPMIDASKNYTWKPNGVYTPYKSNYEVMYCCDLDTDYIDGTYYKRLNLEDSEYFNSAKAAKIRAIVTNSYPYVSLDTMKEKLAESGFAQAREIDRAEAIAAVQAAIWNCANGHEDYYRATANLRKVGNSWGGVMHDYSVEMSQEIQTQPKRDAVYPEIGERLEALIAHLLKLEENYADKAQIIISKLEMNGAPVQVSEDTVKLQLNLELNNSGSGYEDNIGITISSSYESVTLPVVLGNEQYSIEIEAYLNDEIKAVVSGTQVLPAGVYFYAPKAADVNGDGVATSREVSQNLVGVAMGETPVYAEASLKLQNVTFQSGEVSNISYMFINKETGEVEFLKKIDIDDDVTSVPIIAIDGYVSAMFMKQATSGMFWFSEEVDEELVNATIDCLKANNPSYKGHNAIAYGEGAHKLEFKKNKFATYTFGNGTVDTGTTVAVDTTVKVKNKNKNK